MFTEEIAKTQSLMKGRVARHMKESNDNNITLKEILIWGVSGIWELCYQMAVANEMDAEGEEGEDDPEIVIPIKRDRNKDRKDKS